MLISITKITAGFGVVVLALVGSRANAQSLTTYFTLKSDTAGANKLTTSNIGAINSTLELSVWMKSSSSFNAFAGESFFAFDRTSSTNPDTAVLTQNKIGLQGNSLSALTPSGVFGVNNGVYYDIDPNPTPSFYGISYDFGASAGTPVNMSTARKLYDITLYNKGLSSGSAYTVRLVNNGAQEFQNNFVVDGSGAKIADGETLTITAVPEPATMAIFGAGLIPFLRRRRRK